MMTRGVGRLGFTVAWVVAVGACAGTRLNDVGDIDRGASSNGNGAGESSAGAENGPNGSGGSGAGTATSGSGGLPAAGRGGSQAGSDDGPGQGGDTGQPGGPTLRCDHTCRVIAEGNRITSIAADAEQVYWVDYGTRDEHGNYLSDGRLWARALEGAAAPTLVAEALKGPISVAVSSRYAYIMLDEAESKHAKLIRILLTGSEPEELASIALDVTQPRPMDLALAFATTADASFYAPNGYGANSTLYRIAETAGAQPEPFLTGNWGGEVATDGELLYLGLTDGLWSVPIAGGEPTLLNEAPFTGDQLRQDLALSDDYVYAIGWTTDGGDSDYDTSLVRLPKSGGDWTIVDTFKAPLQWGSLQIRGGEVFTDITTSPSRSINRAPLSDPGQMERLTLATPGADNPQSDWPWRVTSAGVFFAYDGDLYLTE